MASNGNLPNPMSDHKRTETRGFDLHRAYRAMIREILRRQLPHTVVPSVRKEDSNV